MATFSDFSVDCKDLSAHEIFMEETYCKIILLRDTSLFRQEMLSFLILEYLIFTIFEFTQVYLKSF